MAICVDGKTKSIGMTSELALEYIRRRMLEMGYQDYLLRLRHLLLKANETREITGYNQLFMLIEPTQDIRIESDVGVFDINEDHANELQYEHRGKIKTTNLSLSTINVRYLQAIPNFYSNASNK